MARLRSPFFVIFFTVFIDMVGFGIVIPVLPLYAEHFHASPVVIGWLTGIFSGVQILCMPLLGRLSDRYGRRPVLLVSILGTAFGFFVMGWAQTVTLLFIGRIIDGATGGNISTAQAYIADVSTPETRSRAMGLIGAAFGMGMTFGPMIGGLMSQISYAAPFYFATGLALLNAVLLYFLLPESLAAEHRSVPHANAPVTEVFQHGSGGQFALVTATYFFLVAGFAMMTTIFALFTSRRFGYDAHANGYLFAYIGILTSIGQGGLVGRLAKWLGDARLARWGLLLVSLSLLALPLADNLAGLLLICAGLALGTSFSSPTLNGLASRMIDRSWQGRALGLIQAAGSFGRLVGPLLGGWLLMFDLAKPLGFYGRTPFWGGAAICGIALVLAFGVRDPKGKTAAVPAIPETDV